MKTTAKKAHIGVCDFLFWHTAPSYEIRGYHVLSEIFHMRDGQRMPFKTLAQLLTAREASATARQKKTFRAIQAAIGRVQSRYSGIDFEY